MTFTATNTMSLYSYHSDIRKTALNDTANSKQEGKRMGSGKDWFPEKIVVPCKTYVSVFEDPQGGNGKKKELLVAQELELYNIIFAGLRAENVGTVYPNQTGDAIMQRFQKAHSKCMKFEFSLASKQGGRRDLQQMTTLIVLLWPSRMARVQ